MASLIWLVVWLVQGTPEPEVVRRLERPGGRAARVRRLDDDIDRKAAARIASRRSPPATTAGSTGRAPGPARLRHPARRLM